MNDQSLQALLQRAEPTPKGSPLAIDADALLRAALRKRSHAVALRCLAGVGAGAAIVGAAALGIPRRDAAPTTPAPLAAADWSLKRPVQTGFDADRLQREIAALDREAQERLLVVRAVTAMATTSSDDALREKPPVAALDDAEVVRLEAARSAALAWQHANVMEHELRDAPAARREYQRVVERFPSTTWAELASASLSRLGDAPADPMPL
jgi:hypothetical protein